MNTILFYCLVAFIFSSANAALPQQCNDLCNCNTGPIYCAKVQSRIGPHQMQYPGCLNSCFSSCCTSNATLSDIKKGLCTDDVFAEVVTGSHKGPVGLVEPCPEIFLAAVNAVKI